MVVAVHTLASDLRWHPHIHPIAVREAGISRLDHPVRLGGSATLAAMPAPEDPSTESIDDLSFDKAEFEDDGREFACSFCGKELLGSYFQINGTESCEQCRYETEALQTSGSGTGRLVRAVLGGFVAAVLGSLLYYAVLSLTGYEIGLIAIAVGFMVGWAVRWGAQHRGGWAYQGLAVGLTYLAIVSTYVPFLFQTAEEMGIDEAAIEEAMAEGDGSGLIYEVGTHVGPTEGKADPALANRPADPSQEPLTADLAAEGNPELVEEVSLAELGFAETALVVLGGLSLLLALPFLGGFENVIGLVIIFFALAQAWGMNKKLVLEIEGPFAVGDRPTPTAQLATEE